MKGETEHGIKRAKERVAVLLATSMPGTKKLILLIIRVPPKPRCLKGVRNLPAKYKSNH